MILEKKIIQIVILDQDYELLKLRLEQNNQVDFFVVITKNDIKTEITNDKCEIFILPEEINLSDYNFLYTFLREKIPHLLVEFESIFILSNQDEFVDFNRFDEILKKLKYDFIVLKHNVFWWSKKFFSEVQSKGSCVFTSSQFLVNNNIFELLKRRKGQETNFSDFYIQNGWAFKYFNFRPKDSEEYIKNLCSYKKLDDKLNFFTGQFQVPKLFDEIPEKEINLEPKKIFMDFSDFKIKNLPQLVFYGSDSYEIFLENYKINELFKEIKKTVTSPDDIIFLKYNNQTFEFNYSDLGNKFLSEIINPS